MKTKISVDFQICNTVPLMSLSSLVKVVCFLAKIEEKFTRVIYYGTLFSKKAVKQFCFLFKICSVFIPTKEERYTRNFFAG